MTVPIPDPGHTYDETTDLGYIRLLLSDIGRNGKWLYTDRELCAFLTREGSVLLAAAQALDTIADNEALTAKLIRTQDLQTDGTAVADSLRKRAATLRQRHAESDTSDAGFEVTYPGSGTALELGHFQRFGPGWLT